MSDRTGDRGKPAVDASRRGFLKAAGLASTATAAAPLLVAGAPEAEAMRARPDQRAPRYTETEHVRQYYATNRR